jgi:hypothetical protein
MPILDLIVLFHERCGMQDLNDLYFFAQVVDHGGFAQTARALGVPKSRLSRNSPQRHGGHREKIIFDAYHH